MTDTHPVPSPDRLDLVNDLERYVRQTAGLLEVLSDHAASQGETDTHYGLWLACDQLERIERCVRALEAQS